MKCGAAALLLGLSLITSGYASAQSWTLTATLRRSVQVAETDTNFGSDISIYQGELLVGAASEANYTGAGYVYSGDAYAETRLSLAAPNSYASMAGSVSLEGDTALMGSSRIDGAKVYVFERIGGQWVEQAPIPESGETFGFKIVQRGNLAILSAPKVNSDTGMVHVYERQDGTWTELQEVVASDATKSDFFGYSIDYDGETLVVGAPANLMYPEGRAGVYVYMKQGGQFIEQTRLTIENATDVSFGSSVSLSGDTLAIGPMIYVGGGASWTLQQILDVPDEDFGTVTVQGDTAYGLGHTGSAYNVYVFRRTDGVWAQAEQFALPTIAEGYFSLAVRGGTLAAGHYLGESPGEVYVYRNLAEDALEESSSAGGGESSGSCSFAGAPRQSVSSVLFLPFGLSLILRRRIRTQKCRNRGPLCVGFSI